MATESRHSKELLLKEHANKGQLGIEVNYNEACSVQSLIRYFHQFILFRIKTVTSKCIYMDPFLFSFFFKYYSRIRNKPYVSGDLTNVHKTNTKNTLT